MLVMRGSQQPSSALQVSIVRVVVIRQKNETNYAEEEKLIKTVNMAFPNLKKKTARAFIKALSFEQKSEYLARTACQRVRVLSYPGEMLNQCQTL